MEQDFVERIIISNMKEGESSKLPLLISKICEIIHEFYTKSNNNKLCIVLPNKDSVAQLLSIVLAAKNIQDNYQFHSEEIRTSYRNYRRGDRLVLNNKLIVEWIGSDDREISFKSGNYVSSPASVFRRRISDVFMLQKTGNGNKNRNLSSAKAILKSIQFLSPTPLDKLLDIGSFGNMQFLRSSMCLVSRHLLFDTFVKGIKINSFDLFQLFNTSRIHKDGSSDDRSPFYIAGKLSNLLNYLSANQDISQIVIDGFTQIYDNMTDFGDLDKLGIKTLLIADLSESDKLVELTNFGFSTVLFLKQDLTTQIINNINPLTTLGRKLKNYTVLEIHREICHDEVIESLVKRIYSVKEDKFDENLSNIKIYLIRLIKILSGIAFRLGDESYHEIRQIITNIETLYDKSQFWLGDAQPVIWGIINTCKLLLERFRISLPEKGKKLLELLKSERYDYILCATDHEMKLLNYSCISTQEALSYQIPETICFSDLNDTLLGEKPAKVIVLSWLKYNNVNSLINANLFTNLTFLFYRFENKYYASLKRFNDENIRKIKQTVFIKNINQDINNEENNFSEQYDDNQPFGSSEETQFSIIDFELSLDNIQYSKYYSRGDITESVKSKRINFEKDLFIYASEAHKFLVINDLFDNTLVEAKIYRSKVEMLDRGNIIAFIITDRDILVELVEKNTNPGEYREVKKWTDLWKDELRFHYYNLHKDFNMLVKEMRIYGCRKQEVTIRTWLQDDNRIGPDDDADLASIARLTNSSVLLNNISKVRSSITKMKGWRHKASDFISERIKSQIFSIANPSLVNSKIDIEGLGSVIILKVKEISKTWQEIDVRYTNRLLKRDII